MTANLLDRDSGLPLWRQIAAILEREIGEGLLRPGARLDTEARLAARFRVNRHTVRQALAQLAEKGLVRTEQGRGTFVHEHVLEYRVSRRTRFTRNLADGARTPGGILLDAGEQAADAATAEALGVGKGTRVIRIRRVGVADGVPVSLAAHHFPRSRFPGLVEAFAQTGSITRALESYGITDYFRHSTRVSARLPTFEEAEVLRQPRVRPVLVTESINVDPEGRVIEYGVARFAGDRVHLVFEPGEG